MELELTEDAVKAVAQKSLERKTGARGLRSIMEKAMMDVMYRIPSDDTIAKCIVTKETIENGEAPLLEYRTDDVKEITGKKKPRSVDTKNGEIA